MATTNDIYAEMQRYAPLELAESWDNPGLLVDCGRGVSRVLVTLDIIRSNIAVARIVLSGRQRNQTEGFLVVPLTLTNTFGLVILACIVTATPGSAWLEYSATRSAVLIHVLDLVDADKWIKTLKDRYENLLLEIFE